MIKTTQLPTERINYLKALISTYKAKKEVGAPDFDNAFHSLLQINEKEEFNTMDYKNLMVAIMAVFTNPKVSLQLEEYYQERIGKMLLSLEYFFVCLDTKEFDVFIDEAKVRFSASLTEENTNHLIRSYEEK